MSAYGMRAGARYHRGDPFLGFLTKGVKAALGVAGRATGLLPPTMGAAPPMPSGPPPVMPGTGRMRVTRTPGVRGFAERLVPGGATGYEVSMNGANGRPKAPGGYHWNKSDYFLRDGTFIPKGTKLVKNRRRNPLNPKALSRSLDRIESAKRATSDMSRVRITPKCPRGCRCDKCK